MTKPTKTTNADGAAPAPKAAKTTRTASKKTGSARKSKAAAPSPLEIAAALNAERAPAESDAVEADASAASAPPTAGPTAADPLPATAPAPAVSAVAATAVANTAAPTDDDVVASDASFGERVRSRAGVADVLVFRVGTELFAACLAAIEEALELPRLSHLPEMPPSMLGVISLRGRMLPAYSPARPLGVALARADAAALVVRAGDRRVALAVDDVDDVMTVNLAELRPPPIVAGEERDAVLLGVASRGGDLVAVLDADALVNACLSDQQALEIA